MIIKRPNYKKLQFIALILFSIMSFSQNNRIEKSIIKAVDKHSENAIDLIKESVNINSGTMNWSFGYCF